MFVRLALDDEEHEFIRMVLANIEETAPGEPYSLDVLRATFRSYLEKATPTLFFVEDKGKIVGLLGAYICLFDYRDGLYTTQRILYVSPENRGTRAAVLLVKELIRWSKSLGAVKIDGGNDNSFKSDRTASFLEHFGFENIGHYLTLNLERGDG
jgi:GNAT superfamily N-acetyltransferase